MNPQQPQPHWQPAPPPGGWPGGPPPPYAAAPPPRRPRPAALRWIAAAVVFAVLLAGAVVVNRTVVSRFLGGASSPEEAVTQLIAAIEKGDTSRLGLLLPPDEVAGLSDVIREARRIADELGESGTPGDMTSTEGLTVRVENLELDATEEQDGLTKVAITNADITATLDPSKLSDPLKKYVEEERLDTKEFTVEVRGAKITVNDDTETFRLDGDEQPPFVMTVERDGSWYVSPTFTYFQYASEDEGRKTSPVRVTRGAESPVAAAEKFTSALADAISKRDITELADASGGIDGRILATYRELLNGSMREESRDDISLRVEESEFRVLSEDRNTARVKIERLRVAGSDGDDDGELAWDGKCLKITAAQEYQQFCIGDKTVGPFGPLIDKLNFLVAVRSDGGWKISATRTLFAMLADVLSWVGDNELPVIKAFMRRDISEVTKVAKTAGKIDIGDRAAVDVEPIGPYLDGGYVVVEIPNPKGAQFSVSCQSSWRGCDIILVTPSGKEEPKHRGGRSREKGDYKAVVIGPAGEVDVTVKSR